jgi:hypothetical protein
MKDRPILKTSIFFALGILLLIVLQAVASIGLKFLIVSLIGGWVGYLVVELYKLRAKKD